MDSTFLMPKILMQLEQGHNSAASSVQLCMVDYAEISIGIK